MNEMIVENFGMLSRLCAQREMGGWRGEWLCSFASAVIAFIIIYIVCPVQFDTNDDSAIQMILSGSMSGGKPEGQLVFINRWLGFALSGLFSVLPTIPWWALFHILILYISVLLTNYTLAVLCRRRWESHSCKYAYLALFGFLLLIDLSLFLYPIARMQFSITSAVAPACVGFSIVVLTFCEKMKDEKSPFSCSVCIIEISITLLAALMRFESAIIASFFAVMAGGYAIFSNRGNGLIQKKVMIVLGLGAALVFIGYTADKVSYCSTEWTQFIETDKQRSGFMDYPHSTYREDPELYESIGWNEETYNLVTNWCFMIDSVNGESFREINRKDPAVSNSFAFSWIRDFFWRDGEFGSLPFVAYTIAMISLCIVVAFFSANRCSRMLISCCALMCFALWSVLSAMGRFIFRAAFPSMFATIMLSIAIILISGDKRQELTLKRERPSYLLQCISVAISIALIVSAVEQFGGSGRLLYLVPAVTCCVGMATFKCQKFHLSMKKLAIALVILPGLFSIYRLNRSGIDYLARKEQDLQFECIQSYLQERGNEVFIVPTIEGSTTSPWRVEFPENAYPMGGWPFYMPWRQEQMVQRDGTNLELDDLIDSGSIRLLTSSDWSLEMVTDYLDSQKAGVLVEECDELPCGERVYLFKTS